eukprot:3135566-Rhodomonas_salina.1
MSRSSCIPGSMYRLRHGPAPRSARPRTKIRADPGSGSGAGNSRIAPPVERDRALETAAQVFAELEAA